MEGLRTAIGVEVDSPEEEDREERRRNMDMEEQEAGWLSVSGSVRPIGAEDSREEEEEEEEDDRKRSGTFAG